MFASALVTWSRAVGADVTSTAASAMSGRSAAGGVNLDFDATLLVQAAFVLILWAVLKPVLFDPMIKLFAEREQRIEGAMTKARRIDDKSAQAKVEYDELMAKARAEGAAEREKLRGEGVRKEGELLAKVRGETQSRVEAARAETQREVDSTRAKLVPHTSAIAKDLVKRVLGREVAG